MKTKNIFAAALLIGALSAQAQDVKIDASTLPKDATKFLTQHFTDKPIHHASKDSDSYEVKLSDGTEVEFNFDGSWREVDGKSKGVPTSYLPQSIAEYTGSNYSGSAITKVERDSRKFDVELSNGKELEFDLNGKFLRVDR